MGVSRMRMGQRAHFCGAAVVDPISKTAYLILKKKIRDHPLSFIYRMVVEDRRYHSK